MSIALLHFFLNFCKNALLQALPELAGGAGDIRPGQAAGLVILVPKS
jgi:hypothetical protein